MSGDYWLNRIGTAATVTTPSGSVPQYGLAADIGTAAWPDAQTFNTWAQDGVALSRSQDIAAIEKAKEQADRGWWQKIEDFGREFLGHVGGRISKAGGAVAGEDGYDSYLRNNQQPTYTRAQFEALGDYEQQQAIGGSMLQGVGTAPGIKQLGQAWEFATAVIETPLIIDRNTGFANDLSLWFDGSEWAAAWREAEERTIGEAFLDSILANTDMDKGDLDRMRRTNSLYGMTSFAVDLYAGFKFDPSVVAAKGVGEAKRISIGALPNGQTSRLAGPVALEAARSADPASFRYAGASPAGHYGAWRGRQVAARFDDVRKAALEMNYTDFSHLPMFRHRAVNGPQAALAMQIAAKDDNLWDLTRRAVLADPKAWREIEAMKLSVPDELQKYAGTNAATFIDAIEATKTKMGQLQSEVADLQKTIAQRELTGPTSPLKGRPGHGVNEGFFEYHTWELKRDLADKVADIEDADNWLQHYDDYGTWLEKIKDDKVWANIEQVNATGIKPQSLNFLSTRTYQKSAYGKAHTVASISKAGWHRQANPIDLHRVDSGVLSIRRQFEQFAHLFKYANPEAVEDLLQRFVRAKDATARYKIAQEVEDVHLVDAIAQYHRLDPQTVDAFLRATRLRRNEMADVLMSGEGAVYSTAPNALDSAKLVKRLPDGMVEIEMMDNGRRMTLRVPEEALQPQNLAVDPTQTPNLYTPMDTRQVHLAVKRNAELFELIDSDFRNGMRNAAGKTMEAIDKYGTAFNSLWKPLQLFRLAWPQRVLMDEWFRGMAVLGASAWAKAYVPALTAASMNAINPTLHPMALAGGAALGAGVTIGALPGLGIAGAGVIAANMGINAFRKRRALKIGPGPLADEITGRKFDVPTHELAVEAAPYVPASLAPTFNGNRARATVDFLNQAIPASAVRQRARAMLRNPNPTRSLPDEAYGAGGPANWQDIDSALGDVERRELWGEWEATTGDDLAIARRNVEEFDSGDFAYAAAGVRMSDEDVLAELSGIADSDLNKLDRFLMAPPELQAALWNDDTITPWSDLGDALRAIEDIQNEFRPGGHMRQIVRDAIKAGKNEFQREVAHRKTGAGHRPLFTGVFNDLDSPYSRLELMLAKELGAKWVPITQQLSAAGWSYPNRRLAIRARDLTEYAADHPIYTKVAETLAEAHGRRAGRPGVTQTGPSGAKASVRMFDPTNGRVTRQGYAVRVASTTIDEGAGHPSRLTEAATIDAIDRLVLQNQQFLSSNGYRLLVEATPEGKARLSVVRYFRTNEQAKAIEYARHTDADSFYRLGGKNYQTRPQAKRNPVTGELDEVGTAQVGQPTDAFSDGYELYIRDWNDQSPIMEELQRQFGQYVEEGDQLSTTPAPLVNPPEGPKPVFHGSGRDLPEQLRPRIEAPIDMGRVYGPGFYTAVDPNTASSYGNKLYTIKDTRSGKRYNFLSMDDPISGVDRERLLADFDAWANSVQDAGVEYFGLDRWEIMVDGVRRDLDSAYAWDGIVNQVANGDLGSYFGGPTALRADEWLSEWFLNVKDVGALRTQWGGHDTGAIYVWLDPENLVIKPAYGGGDQWYLLEEWFSNPDSLERLVNQVPESRIVRTGPKPDPRIRELNAAVRARLASHGPNDPTYQALLGRQQRMAQRLGIEDVAGGDLRRAEVHEPNAMVNAFEDMNFSMIDSVHERFIRKLFKRREFGKGHSKWTSRDGKTVVAQNLLEGEGEAIVPLLSAAPTYSRLTDTYKRTLSRYRQKAVGYKRIQPPDLSPEALKNAAGRKAVLDYYAEWSDLLNDQIRNSPIWYRMLAGESDDAILAWLNNSDEGARLRRSLPHKGRNPEKWVEEHRQALDFYLPDTTLQAALRDRKIRPSDLRRVDQNALPEIFGPELEMVYGEKGWGKEIAALSEKIYHALGTVPTDMLSRQPFAKAMYDLKMRNLIRSADSDWLTPEVLKDYERLSREFAIKQLRRTLFDLTDETNFTQAIRFLAPFWGAQEEAIVKWMRIAIERPETIARFYVGMNTVYEHMTVIDEDGEPVKDAGFMGYNPNHRVVVQIPENLKKLPFFEKALKDFGTVGVSFGAANTTLQGDNPLLPSLGPIVTVPANQFADSMWDTHGTQFDDNFFYRWLFPIGRPSNGASAVLEQIFPGWGRRMLAMQQGQDSRMWMNTWFSVYREMALDHKKRGLPPPSPAEVEQATKWHFALRVVAAFGAPAAMEFRPNNQFFLDQYHEMQRTYGPAQAFEKFVQTFGADAAAYAASSSEGMAPPTSKGMEEWSQNKDLVQGVTEMGFPDLAAALYSPEAWTDDFSSDAYGEQFSINVGPGSTRKLRESHDPLERAAATDRRVGWVQYRQFMSSINAELYNRGLTSLEQTGAEDLQELKRAWVADLERSNLAWSTDFRTYSDTIYQQVGVLSQIAFDKRFDSRPDMLGLRQYLMIRQAAAQSLDQWAAQGGSRSLQAQENTDLRNWFYDQVGQLVQANPAFGEFYVRFLDSDRLERGSGP